MNYLWKHHWKHFRPYTLIFQLFTYAYNVDFLLTMTIHRLHAIVLLDFIVDEPLAGNVVFLLCWLMLIEKKKIRYLALKVPQLIDIRNMILSIGPATIH